MSDSTATIITPQKPTTATKTPRKRPATSSGRSEADLQRFKLWLEENSFKSNGGFLPHLRKMMDNPDLPTYSKASFYKQPKEGYKLVMRFALAISSFRSPVRPLKFFFFFPGNL